MPSTRARGPRSRVLDNLNGRSLAETAERFGDEVNRFRHLSECPCCGESGHGSGKVYPGRYGQDRWSCFRCDLHGGVADYLAYKLGLDARWSDLDQEGRDKVIAWAIRHAKALGKPKRPPTVAPGAVRAPHKAALDTLWAASKPVDTAPDTIAMLEARKIPVDKVVPLDLARQLPSTDLPEWAEGWARRHHLLIRGVDANGEPVTVRARAVTGHQPKELAPAWGDGSSRGCVFATEHELGDRGARRAAT